MAASAATGASGERNAMKNKKKGFAKSPSSPCNHPDEFAELFDKLQSSKSPDERDVQRYRNLAVAHPDRWRSVTALGEVVRNHFIKSLASGGASRAYVMAELDLLKKEMGYNSSSSVEKLLIEQILTTKLHLHHAEHIFNEKSMESTTLAVGEYWQRFLSSAQRRHLRAIETLVRVRRLMRGGPLVQVNINNAGSGQTSVQGELFSHSDKGSTPAIDV